MGFSCIKVCVFSPEGQGGVEERTQIWELGAGGSVLASVINL